MAIEKIKLNTLGTKEHEIKYVPYGNVVIEVKTSLPYEEIIDLIQWAINYTMGDRTFISEPLKRIMADLAIIKGFTNLDVDRIEMNDCSASEVYEMYDIVKSTVLDLIKENIDEEQLKFFNDGFEKTLDSLIIYSNSAAGILEKIQNDKMAQTMQIDAFKDFLENDKDTDRLISIFKMMGLDTSELAAPKVEIPKREIPQGTNK